MADEKKPGWVEGRTRESADGMSRRRPPSADDQRRMREAAEREQAKTDKRKGRDGGSR